MPSSYDLNKIIPLLVPGNVGPLTAVQIAQLKWVIRQYQIQVLTEVQKREYDQMLYQDQSDNFSILPVDNTDVNLDD